MPPGGIPNLTVIVIGTGDYNGEGRADVIWRNTSGLIVDWTMNGVAVQSGTIVSALDGGWRPLR